MRIRLLTALLAWSLLGYTGHAAAQDDEEEGDVDALMASDPEREEEEEEEEEEEAPAEEEAERPPAPPGEQQGDDERPPGEEPVAEETKAPPPPEPESLPYKKLSIGVLIGYGINLDSNEANPWGLGFGARVGYNFGGFYLGGRIGFNLGGSFDEFQGGTTASSNRFMRVDRSSWEIGPEAGYDIFIGESFDLRPFLGVGIAVMSRTEAATAIRPETTTSDGQPFVAPGVALLFGMGDAFFLGLGARLQIIFQATGDFIGIPLNLNIGMRF